MEIKHLVVELGGSRKIAAELGLRPSAIRNWSYDGYIPPKHHSRIIKLAKKHGLKLTKKDLDPLAA